MAFLVLIFSLSPCSGEVGDDCGSEIHVVVSDQGADDHEDTDECGNTCNCACCAISVPYTLDWYSYEPSRQVDLKMSLTLNYFPPGPTEIWQPPKI